MGFRSFHVLERVGDLRHVIFTFVMNTTCQPAAPLSAELRILHTQKTPKACQHTYTSRDLEQLDHVLDRLFLFEDSRGSTGGFLS